MASADDIGELEVFPKGVSDISQVLNMRWTEIDIVIQDGAGGLGILQETLHRLPACRIQRVKGTEQDHIIREYLWILEILTLRDLLPIERI